MKLIRILKKSLPVLLLTLVLLIAPLGLSGVLGDSLPSFELTETAFAQAANTNTTTAAAAQADGVGGIETPLNQILLLFASTVSVILEVLYFITWPILIVIGMLMDNSLIFGAGMEDRLLSVWQQIRNLVNIAAVFGLVGLALYNVLAVDTDGNYTLKKILPRLVLVLILVNFSFFAVRLVVDAANVVTAAVFTLPNSIESTSFTSDKADDLGRKLCTASNNTSGVSTTNATVGAVRQTASSLVSSNLCSGTNELNASTRQLFQRFNQTNMALLMAVEFGQIQDLLDASALVRQNPSVSTLLINLLISLVYYAVYLAGYVALMMILVARLVVIWAATALSPILMISFGLPSGAGSESISKLKEYFTKHLIAPIKAGFAMSLGYIMLSALTQIGPDSLTFQGANQFLAPFSGISSIQEFIVAAGSVGILWFAVKDIGEHTVVSGLTGKLFEKVKDVGLFAAQVPTFLPLPTGLSSPGGKAATLSNAFKSPDLWMQKVRNAGSLDTSNEPDPPPKGSDKQITYLKSFDSPSKVTKADDAERILAALAVEKNYTDSNMKVETLVKALNQSNLMKKLEVDAGRDNNLKNALDYIKHSSNQTKSVTDVTEKKTLIKFLESNTKSDRLRDIEEGK